MNLEESLKTKIEELEKILLAVNKELKTAPKGYIRVSYKHKCPQYYLIMEPQDRNGTYLNKNQTAIIKSILQRDYNKKLKKTLEEQLRVLKKCYANFSQEKLENIYSNTKIARQKYITPKLLTTAQFVQNWQAFRYTPKEIDPQLPVILTSAGLQVRSKSEVIIAETLTKLQVPFRYEAPRQIGGKNFHPDFTCLNIRTRQEFIWEHFGLMDNPEYVESTVWKIQFYRHHGYNLGENLILTFEDKKHPFTVLDAEEIIRAHLA